tara:strand:+ start:820 stop:1002 length:183 start_codon:yes stop_codon:yes gene_type:complete
VGYASKTYRLMNVAIAIQPIKVPNIAKGIVINNSSNSLDFFKRINLEETIYNVNNKLSLL